MSLDWCEESTRITSKFNRYRQSYLKLLEKLLHFFANALKNWNGLPVFHLLAVGFRKDCGYQLMSLECLKHFTISSDGHPYHIAS
jgi:hypothetical protein